MSVFAGLARLHETWWRPVSESPRFWENYIPFLFAFVLLLQWMTAHSPLPVWEWKEIPYDAFYLLIDVAALALAVFIESYEETLVRHKSVCGNRCPVCDPCKKLSRSGRRSPTTIRKLCNERETSRADISSVKKKKTQSKHQGESGVNDDVRVVSFCWVGGMSSRLSWRAT